MLDTSKLDEVDEQDNAGEDTEADGQGNAGIFQHVYTFVCIYT